LKGQSVISLAVYHYRDMCLDEDMDLLPWTAVNPDNDIWTASKFSVVRIREVAMKQNFTVNTPAGYKEKGTVGYFPAPTRSASEIGELLATLRGEQPVLIDRRGTPDVRAAAERAQQETIRHQAEILDSALRDQVERNFCLRLGFVDQSATSAELQRLRSIEKDALEVRTRLQQIEVELAQLRARLPRGMDVANLTDRAWWDRLHESDKAMVMALTGLPNPNHLFKVLYVARLLFGDTDPNDDLSHKPTQDICDAALQLSIFLTPSSDTSIAQRRSRHAGATLSLFAEQIICLFIRRTGTSMRVCAALFGLGTSTIAAAHARWLPRLGGVLGRILANLPMSKAAAERLAPAHEDTTRTVKGYDAAFSLDGKTVATDDVKISPSVHRLQYSSKLSASGATGVAMVFHTGFCVGVSDMMMGRNSENLIVEVFADRWTLGPWAAVLADRGFTTLYQHTGARVFLPAFKPANGRAFCKADLLDSLANAQERWKVETFFSRVSAWRTCHHGVRR